MQVSSRPSQRACKSRLDTCDGRLERRADPHATEHATGTDIHTHVLSRERDETPRASGGGSSCSQILLYTLSGGALSHVRVNSEHTCSRFGAVARTSRRGRLPRVVRVLSRSRVGARSTLPPRVARAAARRRPQRAGPDRSVRAQPVSPPRTLHGPTRSASEHPRVPIFFSAFALRSIIQHKSVAPPAQNPYWLVLYDAVHGRSSASWATWAGPAACPPPQPACPTLGTLSVAQGPPWPLCR